MNQTITVVSLGLAGLTLLGLLVIQIQQPVNAHNTYEIKDGNQTRLIEMDNLEYYDNLRFGDKPPGLMWDVKTSVWVRADSSGLPEGISESEMSHMVFDALMEKGIDMSDKEMYRNNWAKLTFAEIDVIEARLTEERGLNLRNDP